MSEFKENNTAPVAAEESQEQALAVVQENDLILKFKKPYVFEGKTYTELDLSGLEDATGKDLCEVDKLLKRQGMIDPLMEMSPALACYMAARVTHKPVEFFEGLPMPEVVRLKTMVSGFMYGGGED